MSAALVVGKLPCHGDFVARGVDARQRREIDAWLSASIASAREQLGGRFDEAFDCAPPWQFAWRDERWTAGALAPSVDSAGRRFPLLVARKDLDESEVRAAAKLCEEAAAAAIAERRSADELVGEVEAVEVASDGGGCSEGWWNEELGDAARIDERLPPTILAHMLAAVIA